MDTGILITLYLEDGICLVSLDERRDCGWEGIRDWQCQARGCCYDPTVQNTVWCFYPSTGMNMNKRE